MTPIPPDVNTLRFAFKMGTLASLNPDDSDVPPMPDPASADFQDWLEERFQEWFAMYAKLQMVLG